MRQLRFGVVLCGAVVGCKAVEPPAPIEGTNAGECEDGADNDVDGYFDCDDNNCWGAPICKDGGGGGGGNDTDDGGGGDTDPDDTVDVVGTGFADNLKSFSMTYLISYEFDNLGQTICTQYYHQEQCNCSAVYSGHGVLAEADDDRNTYFGEWKLEATNCFVLNDGREQTEDPTLNDGSIWRPSPTTEAYHTFHFKPSMNGAFDWITHAEISAHERVTEDIMEHEQYWIRLTEPHTLDNDTWLMPYRESETKYIDLMSVVNVSDVHFAFSETGTPPELTLPELFIP